MFREGDKFLVMIFISWIKTGRKNVVSQYNEFRPFSVLKVSKFKISVSLLWLEFKGSALAPWHHIQALLQCQENPILILFAQLIYEGTCSNGLSFALEDP